MVRRVLGNSELDNIAVASFPDLLCRDTVTERFYPLIDGKERLVSVLLSFGIKDKYAYWDAPAEVRTAFVHEMAYEPSEAALFERFLHLYDFIPRCLSDVREVEGFSAFASPDDGMRSSGDYLRSCMRNGLTETAKTLQISAEHARELFLLCDLMRLPGVKWLRAKLYLDSGFAGTEAFSRQDAPAARDRIAACIASSGSSRAVPQKKELSTQIAVARALPRLLART